MQSLEPSHYIAPLHGVLILICLTLIGFYQSDLLADILLLLSLSVMAPEIVLVSFFIFNSVYDKKVVFETDYCGKCLQSPLIFLFLKKIP